MRTLRPSRGDSKIGCLFWLVVVGFGAYVALQMIPAKMKAAELQKFMLLQAEQNGEEPVERLRSIVLQQIKELQLPVEPKALVIDRSGGRLKMSYPYTVQINLVATTWDMPFDVKIDRPIFVI